MADAVDGPYCLEEAMNEVVGLYPSRYWCREDEGIYLWARVEWVDRYDLINDDEWAAMGQRDLFRQRQPFIAERSLRAVGLICGHTVRIPYFVMGGPMWVKCDDCSKTRPGVKDE